MPLSMADWAQELAAQSFQRVTEYDKKRKQYAIRQGQTMPDLDDLPIGGSRQFRLAVLSVDIRHFTDISWGLKENYLALAQLQALYLSEMSAVIKGRGGVTEKYTGLLGAVDVFTVPTTFSVLESVRLDLGVGSQVHA